MGYRNGRRTGVRKRTRLHPATAGAVGGKPYREKPHPAARTAATRAATRAGLQSGLITYRHAQVIMQQAWSLPNDTLARFEQALRKSTPHLTVSILKLKAHTTRERLHPESIETTPSKPKPVGETRTYPTARPGGPTQPDAHSTASPPRPSVPPARAAKPREKEATAGFGRIRAILSRVSTHSSTRLRQAQQSDGF